MANCRRVAVFLLETEAEAEATKNTIPFAHLPICPFAHSRCCISFVIVLRCCVVVGMGNGTNQHINQRIGN
jgi:hypothetical protein